MVPIGLEQDRLIRLPSESTDCFIPIEEVLKLFADQLFNGIDLLEAITFRITRNADMQVQEDQAPDLMSGMESILSQRKTSNCVRLELESCATKNHHTLFAASAESTRYVHNHCSRPARSVRFDAPRVYLRA